MECFWCSAYLYFRRRFRVSIFNDIVKSLLEVFVFIIESI